MTSPAFTSILWFVAIIAMIPAVLWLLKRTPMGGAGTHGFMRSIAVLPISPSQRVVTIEVGRGEERRWLVLGVTGQNITTLHTMAPQIAFVEKQAQRIGDSMATIESQRAFVEDLHRRMTELQSLAAQMDERGRELMGRMEGAEQRFVGLSSHAEEAERMTMTLASVTSSVILALRYWARPLLVLDRFTTTSGISRNAGGFTATGTGFSSCGLE